MNIRKGRRFGKLVVLGKAISKKYESGSSEGRTRVRCGCGIEKDVRNTNLRNGRSKSCGCEKGPKRLKHGEAAINSLRYRYIYGARSRNFKWSLTKIQFRNFVLSPCWYCGDGFKFSRYRIRKGSQSIRLTGIDRKNSSEGYTFQNCVPCCGKCNLMKMSLSDEEFLKLVRKVYFNSERRNKLSTVTSSFITISCDAPECDKTATFPQTPEGEQEAMKTSVWLNGVRFVQTLDGRKFTYCSDECEIKTSGLGAHNKQVIVKPSGANTVDLAAQAAARAAAATEALKSGNGKVTLE